MRATEVEMLFQRLRSPANSLTSKGLLYIVFADSTKLMAQQRPQTLAE